MQAFYADEFVLPLPEGHRFPMAKYRMLRDRIASELRGVALQVAPAATDAELALAHSLDYVQAVAHGTLSAEVQREIGFPWSAAMAERARRSVGATLGACRAAMQEGVAGNLAGGTHHAYADRGSGFCVFNDVAVAARLMQSEQSLAPEAGMEPPQPLQVAVIDLDVHQGNGTARIFEGDASVFTLSLHGERNFPFRKETSDLDVPLPDGCCDADYLHALDGALDVLAQRFRPGLVMYLAGADPHEGDRLGRLALSFEGLQMRDQRVLEWAWQRRVPVAISMAGGYGRDIATTVQAQFNTWQVALQYHARWQNVAA